LAAAASVRLLAVDRPGYAATPVAPARDVEPPSFVAALASLIDDLGLDDFAVLAWSGGALDALTVATSLSTRVTALHLVGGIVPFEAFDDPAVQAAAPGRAALREMADDYSVAGLATMLAPYPCDHDLARAWQAEQRGPDDQARLATIPGALDRMASALVEAVSAGLAGVERDLAAQVEPSGLDLASVTAPVHLWYGEEDEVAPPAFAHWYAAHLPNARVHLVPDAGHFLPFTHWRELLHHLAAGAG
jgi:pimeloyl-ACP methyl ester carboxylesterase